MTLRSGHFSPYFKTLLSSAFLLAFYSFLRLSEFTSPSNSFVPSRDLAFSDLKFYPDHFKLYCKQTKTKGTFHFHCSPRCLFQPMFTLALKRHKSAHPSCPFSSLQSSHDRLLVPQISEANFAPP
ncbi:hypothetical protein ATANTOWER_026594 [Ataeniobius toweri]|uniref:Uncharacterized protein n=1 Tax=Ataeniobius toweri TaxID=208326 RepID=A0ABU7AT46_9TELE|nr:hypothetical protein [Ataeniobius toweri]